MVDLSMNQTIKLLRLASLGKMIGGLIHNVNGPMQNLGLEIDMSSHFINNSSKQDKISIKDIQNRLKRMGEEFNRINLLIKDIAVRADVNNEYFALLNFNDFIEKELEFYHANLYFKHNVKMNLELQDGPPMVRNLPENTMLALGWLLLSIIEELENQEGKKLAVKTIIKDRSLDVAIRAEKVNLPEKLRNHINQIPSMDNPFIDEACDIPLGLAIMIFKSVGVTVKCNFSDSDSTEIKIEIPVYT